jgi:Tol biopolymer transport system component
MGEVYRAIDSKLGREVAVKVLPAEFASDSARLDRFEKEARAASSLNHPNIVTIYEIDRTDSGAWIAMELIEGKTLRDLLAAGPLPVRRVLSFAAQLSDGLAKAHGAGIVHRDLKPENLMVTEDGFVKILDFGLAKLVPSNFEGARGTALPTVTRATEPGTVLGTVGYMSPEQASGRRLDFRSDQFSLGAILYEMASGKRAFERPTGVQTLSAIIQEEPEPLSSAAPKLPESLVWIIERCLAKDPEERYESSKDLARDLASLRDHFSGTAVRLEPPSLRVRGRVPPLAVLAAVLATLAIGIFAGQRLQARRDRETPPPRRTTLTFRRGFLTGARFAPDGQTIVYSASWDGKPSEIFSTRVGSTESRPLGISPAVILAVSSTGEMAVGLNRGMKSGAPPYRGTLARVPLAGGAPREILTDVGSADWSPDGKDLAVTHSVGGRNRLEYPIGKVLYESAAAGYLSSVRVSPRGDLVAFLDHPRLDSARGRLSVVDRDGRKKVLTGDWARLRPVLWSPTGEEVFFSRWGEHEIRGVRLSGRSRSAPWIPGLDDVSREGRFLDSDVLLDNVRRIILARVPGAAGEKDLSWQLNSTAADLSSDGRQLLFFESRTDPDQPDTDVLATFLRRTDGSDAVLLGQGRPLALSPDGKWALVRHPTEERLILLPTAAGESRSLPGTDFVRVLPGATFFPGGQRILFVAEDKSRRVRSYIQDVEGGPPRPFGDQGLEAKLVSPDGREVAGWTANGHVIVRGDGEGPPRPIESARPDDTLVRWSSDGKSIFVRGGERQPLTLYRLDLAAGRRERWRELTPPDPTGFQAYAGAPGTVCVTPDGRFYAYTILIDSSRLTLGEAGPDWWK